MGNKITLSIDDEEKSKYVYIDYEYNGVNQKRLNVVSVSFMWASEISTRWLHKNKTNKEELRQDLIDFHNEGYTFVAFSSEAEARSFLSLSMNNDRRLITQMRWIDLYTEYKCISNHNARICYGKHLVKGTVINIREPKPKWERKEGEKESPPMQYGLASALYKFLGVVIDTDHKEKIRDIIIASPNEFSTPQKKAILEYNESDIIYLPKLHKEINKEYRRVLPRKEHAKIEKEMLLRGEYGARTAIMSMDGYPVDTISARNFSNSVSTILSDIQRDINRLFPAIKPFQFCTKELKYKWRQKETRQWIETLPEAIRAGWMRTKKSTKFPKGQYSLSVDAFRRFYSERHNYSEDSLGNQFVRYLTTKTNLNGFLPPPKGKKCFWDFVGQDGRVRPFWNTFGSQSSRTQPSATSFLYLKSAWMRVLNVPPRGVAIGSIDYGSEEFLIAALQSGDMNMITAYMSGDVYFYFAKLARAVPQDAKREDYEGIRDKFKQVVLSMQYLMTKFGLAIRLTEVTGEYHTEEEAQDFIDMFNEAFPDFYDYREQVLIDYYEDGYLKLPCGWLMLGDNTNFRSATNCPTQGFGASIMRLAVKLAQDRGLQVMQTLHDALYIMFKSKNTQSMKVLGDCMKEAFVHYFPKEMKKYAVKIRLDSAIWSLDYPDKVEVIEVEGMKIKKMQKYIDPRGKKEYQRFKGYFNSNGEGLDIL